MKILFQLFVLTECFLVILLLILSIGGSFLFPMFDGYIPSSLELPFGHPDGIAADSQGRIYVIEAASRRIQVFDKNGKFIKGWFVEREKRNEEFKLKVDEQDNLHVFINYDYSNTYDYVFDFDGNLLKKEKVNAYANGMLDYNGEYQYQDNAGNNYSLEGPVFSYPSRNGYAYTFSEVYKTDLSGKKFLVVSRPIYIWLITTPLLAWLFIFGIFASVALRGIAELVIRSRVQKNNLNNSKIKT